MLNVRLGWCCGTGICGGGGGFWVVVAAAAKLLLLLLLVASCCSSLPFPLSWTQSRRLLTSESITLQLLIRASRTRMAEVRTARLRVASIRRTSWSIESVRISSSRARTRRRARRSTRRPLRNGAGSREKMWRRSVWSTKKCALTEKKVNSCWRYKIKMYQSWKAL